MKTSTTSTASSNERKFANLHVTGIGYLNRVREVPVRKGEPFMSCTIRAMYGEMGVKDGIEYTSFDVKATTAQAEGILRDAMEDASNKDKRVMVAFKISDPYIHTFKFENGPRTGESGVQMKGRLLLISHVWVKDLTLGNDDDSAGNVLVYDYEAEQRQIAAEAKAQAEAEAAKTGTGE